MGCQLSVTQPTTWYYLHGDADLLGDCFYLFVCVSDTLLYLEVSVLSYCNFSWTLKLSQ